MTGRRMAVGLRLLATIALVVAACSPGPGGSGAVSAPPSTSPSPSASLAVASASASASATQEPIPSVDIAGARAAFEYPAAKGTFEVVSSKAEGRATIRDVTYQSLAGRTVSALLVVPDAPGPYPAVLFLHWYATNEPDGNRTEFLEEAVGLAAKGVVSLLPQQAFPWAVPPAGAAEDRQSVIDQVIDLRVGLDLLLAQPKVDPDRVAVVGHDFGGMYAAIVASLDQRVKGCVVIASVPHFAEWFLPYWHPVASADEAAYRATMLQVDPVTLVAGFDQPVLLQFADTDRFVSPADVAEWQAAVPGSSSTTRTYQGDHRLGLDQARLDRDAFLAKVLGIAG